MRVYGKLVTCLSNDSEASSVTPSSLSASLNCTVLPATLMPPVMSKPAKHCRVPKASLLPGLSNRAFSINHVDTASLQSATDIRSLNMDGTRAVYSIRSSASDAHERRRLLVTHTSQITVAQGWNPVEHRTTKQWLRSADRSRPITD